MHRWWRVWLVRLRQHHLRAAAASLTLQRQVRMWLGRRAVTRLRERLAATKITRACRPLLGRRARQRELERRHRMELRRRARMRRHGRDVLVEWGKKLRRMRRSQAVRLLQRLWLARQVRVRATQRAAAQAIASAVCSAARRRGLARRRMQRFGLKAVVMRRRRHCLRCREVEARAAVVVASEILRCKRLRR
ncbi:unnamed protein product, partial [Chrysoparadoxa australica]